MFLTFARAIILCLAILTCVSSNVAFSQPFPPPQFPGALPPFYTPPPAPLQRHGRHPVFGQACSFVPGPIAPCAIVERWHRVYTSMSQRPLQPVAAPGNFAICDGPLQERGDCRLVALHFAMLEIGRQEFPLQSTGQNSPFGPICLGPLGPGPCDAIVIFLMQTDGGAAPQPNFDPRAAQLVQGQVGSVGPMCNSPFGPTPCNIISQHSLDRMGGPIAGISPISTPAGRLNDLAAACARQSGLDVAAFAQCTGHRVVLPENQQKVLDCAVSSSKADEFAKCAAPQLGIRLSDDQRVLAGCAEKSRGNAQAFVSCAGGRFLGSNLGENERAVIACATGNAGIDQFVECAAPKVLKQEQVAALKCAVDSGSVRDFAVCAAPHAGIKMSNDQRVVVNCAARSNGDRNSFLSCAGAALVGNNIGPRERAVLACATNGGSTAEFASCAATSVLGDKLSKEQQIALKCAAQSQGDPTGMATCAGANMFGMQLNPEQQIAVQCVVSTGGQPYAAAGCMASRLTARELTKCLSEGVGGKGCFGDTNDLVGRDGWVGRNIRSIAGGPNSVINNPDQIWGGDNSFVRNPHQIFGGSNSFVRNPSQIWGGQNSVFNNPSQLLPQPKPVQIGSIGGKRICLPWC